MKNQGICVRRLGRRIVCAMLSLVLSLSLLPAMAVEAAAAEDWKQPYLEKLVSWGIMRGDSSGDLHADRPITRAEFVVLVNRAFGYSKTSASLPFRDVSPTDWFYDDINIGYTTGYFNGTSANAASPRASVTREQATVLLGRNLILDNDPGASADFSDSNRLGSWSRGIIRTAVAEGIVSGYSDGSFRPKTPITRGQMAVLLVNAIGTPIRVASDQSLGGVYGNVTITAPGVTLRDTTIAGNLYITGGVGLGDIKLENVNVLGKIVISGAGQSEKGENSVLLRNVTAHTLVMDSLANNLVSIRADGDTKIDSTSIRTAAYLEDATGDERGFLKIELDGEEGTTLDAAGNLKEITTKTNKSTVTVAKGSVAVLNVDEAALDSVINVSAGAVAKKVNLDIGATVTGGGDVDDMSVNAPGVSSDILPDNIVIRPGQNADINGSNMDTAIAAESSSDPRLLAGYPKIINLAPTSATAQFRTNKAGTIYWALTSVSDGSVGEDDLLTPSNNARIIKSGNITAALSNTDYSASLSGLTPNGSYYVSAMLVDNRQQHSTVKSISFTTPDNTVPNFASGYPEMSKLTDTEAWVTSMPTKSCQMYFAVLPKGSTAPSTADFKAHSVTGALGFGVMDVTKNVPDVFKVNNLSALEELKTYDLYLWLTDADGAHSSAVKKMTFTTVDRTAPEFVTLPTVNSIRETSLGLLASINENGTIFWAAVKEGTEYPKPMNGQTEVTDQVAQLQISNGMNALKSGKVTASANKDATINITGLASETAYDIYYVAMDRAGNYSAWGKLSAHTLDTNPPSVSQEFTRTNDTEGLSPLADTDVRIVFSENVQDKDQKLQFLKLYNDSKDSSKTSAERESAKAALADLLAKDIQLYVSPSGDDNGPFNLVPGRTGTEAGWTIDYRNAEVTSEEGAVVVTFKNGTGINLVSGSVYRFQIQNVSDTSTNENVIKPNPTILKSFRTVFAQITLTKTSTEGTLADDSKISFHMAFKAVPASTGSVSSTVCYDLLFRTAANVKFTIYTREGETGAWAPAPTGSVGSAALNPSPDGTVRGASYSRWFRPDSTDASSDFELLKDFNETREYGIVFQSIDNDTNSGNWNGTIEMNVVAMATSIKTDLQNLTRTDMTDSDIQDSQRKGVTMVSTPQDFTMEAIFSDSTIPLFRTNYPSFSISDVLGSIDIYLTRDSGTIYYLIAPLTSIQPTLTDGTLINADTWSTLPQTVTGSDDGTRTTAHTSNPTSSNVMNPRYTSDLVLRGKVSYTGSNEPIRLTGLKPETKYCAYFVLQGTTQSSPYTLAPYVFRFETTPMGRPIILLDVVNPSVNIQVDTSCTVHYMLASTGSEGGSLRQPFNKYVDTTIAGINSAYMSDTFTVLDAMSTDYRENGILKGSVFDQYALLDAKNNFANYIRSQVSTGGAIVHQGNQFIAADATANVGCAPYMSSGTLYTFLAVGAAEGSGDAFRAIGGVQNTDDVSPVITSLDFATEGVNSSRATGTLTVTFSEPIYYREQNGLTQVTTPLAAVGATSGSSSYVSALKVFDCGSGISLVLDANPSSPTYPVYMLRFKVTSVSGGTTIGVANTLSDKTGNAHTTTTTLRLEIAKDGDNYRAYFVNTNADWGITNLQN